MLDAFRLAGIHQILRQPFIHADEIIHLCAFDRGKVNHFDGFEKML